MRRILSLLTLAFLFCLTVAARAEEPKIKVLIIGGQNNHNWAVSTPLMKKILDEDPKFETTIDNAPGGGASREQWDAWRPDFKQYDVVVLDYNGQMWPEPVQKAFLDYVNGGGGVLVIHAANNSFSGWKEYEQMVGLLWRSPDYGYSLYVDDDGNVVREEPGQGRGMGHGSQYDWHMTTRDREHPITKGMPEKWMHKVDELYHGQRGPAQDVHILLTAYSDSTRGGTGKNEPIVWWIPYGQGRVVTNVMGHVGNTAPMDCVGFRTLLYRSCEWLADRDVTTPIPGNFPTAEETSVVEQ